MRWYWIPEKVINIFTTNQDIMNDCSMLIITALEDLFDEVEDRLKKIEED